MIFEASLDPRSFLRRRIWTAGLRARRLPPSRSDNNAHTLPSGSSRANIPRECRDIRQEPDVTLCIPERSSPWLVDWHGVTVMGSTLPPPRDPDDDDDEDEDEDAEPDDDLDQPVVREPDE